MLWLLQGVFGNNASGDADAVYYAHHINDNVADTAGLDSGAQAQVKGDDDNPLKFFTFRLPKEQQYMMDAYNSYDDQHWDVFVSSGSGNVVGTCYSDGDAPQKVSNTVARMIKCSITEPLQ